MKISYAKLDAWKGILAFFLFVVSFTGLRAQNITNYTFTPISGTFTPLSGATNPALTAGTANDGYFNNISIGFDFWYMGSRYTTVSASTNGWLSLGSAITDAEISNNLTSGGSPRPVLAPFWDDLDLQSAANLSYVSSGNEGSRVFTIQYLNIQKGNPGDGNALSLQVKLYEGTGKIEFIYRPESGNLRSASASIGISATSTGTGNFLSLNGTGTNPSASSTTETTTLSTRPASGQVYAFASTVPTAPGGLTFTGVSASEMTLNWIDNSSNENGFVIYRSTNDINYTFVEQTSANATSSIQSGLTEGTVYYWKIYAVAEVASTVLSGSQAATCSSTPTVTDASRSGAGAVTLSASGSPGGNYNWYSASSGGTSLASTSSYTTPTLNQSTSFWVTTVNSSGCESTPRTEVKALIHPVPTVSTPSSVCYQNTGIGLDGIDDYADIPDATWFNGDFTVEAWVFVRAHNNWQRLFDFGNGAGSDNVFVALSRGTEGRLQFSTLNGSSGTDLISPSKLPLHEWVHVACVLSGTTGSIYVNGVKVASGTMNVPNNISRTLNYIGKSNWSADAHTNADIDEFRIWNLARTESQIKAGMHSAMATGTSGLLANWRMDEGSGTSISDNQAGITGTLTNGPAWLSQGIIRATGKTEDYTVHLDGTDDYLSVPGGVWFNGDFTVESWVYVKAHQNYQRLIDFGNSEGSVNDHVYISLSSGWSNSGQVELFVANGSSGSFITTTNALPLNQWVHLACVLNGTTGTIFINGEEKARGTLLVPNNLTRTRNYIGRSNWSADAYAYTNFDEVRIWNKARSKAQIQANMNVNIPSNSSGLQAYWKFNEGTGTSATDANGVISTLTNGTGWGYTSPMNTLQYSWSPSTGLNTTTGSSVTASPSSTTTYTVSASSSTGGSATSEVILSVPTSTFSASTPVAINENSTITYTGNATSGASYSWTFDGGTVSSGTGQGPYEVKWLTSGTKNITLTVTENNCASSISTASVTVNSSTLYIWNGSVSSAWGNIFNWTPNGLPGTSDGVTIDSGIYPPVFDGSSGVKNFTMATGTLDLNGYTIGISGVADFISGSIINGTVNLACTEATFGGTTFGANITAVCANIAVNGSIFNGTCSLEKSGSSHNTSSGGNTFNATTTIINSGTGNLVLANMNPDDYNGNVTFAQSNSGSLSPAYNGNNTFSGDITLNSSAPIIFGAGTGTVICDGANAQSINKTGTASPVFNRITINKSANNVSLGTAVTIAHHLSLTSRNIVSSTTNLLAINDDAIVSGASHSSYVEGPVRKTGNDAFTFPVGKKGYYRPVSISAPSTVTDHFTAEYFEANSNSLYTHSSKDVSIHHLSQCEYWIVDRTNGTSNVSVTLSWDTNSCGVSHPSELLVARWDGTSWKDHGNGGTTGNTNSGTLTSAAAITTFSPFTLGSTSENNSLPVELLFFKAGVHTNMINLSWATASEKDNDYFTIEKSTDGVSFQEIARKKGAGNSKSKTVYSFKDHSLSHGLLYYRLKQTDYNGIFNYSRLIQADAGFQNTAVILSPNPFTHSFKLLFEDPIPEVASVKVYNAEGILLFSKKMQPGGDKEFSIHMERYSSGFYYLKLFLKNEVIEKAIIKVH